MKFIDSDFDCEVDSFLQFLCKFIILFFYLFLFFALCVLRVRSS